MAITGASGICASAPASAPETCASAPASRRTSSNMSATSEDATQQEQKAELENMWESYYRSFCGWFSKDKSPHVSFELPDEPHSSTGPESISSPFKSDRPSSSASTNSVSIGEKVPFQLIASAWLIFIYCTVQQSHMTYIGTVLTEFLQNCG